MTSGRGTHFMGGRSTVDRWSKALTPALSQRRKKLGLSRENAKGCLLYDGFTGNEAGDPGLIVERNLWLEQNNMTTAQLIAHSTAEAQPCDAGNAYWRALTDVYEDVAAGFDQDPVNRASLEDIPCDKIGVAQRDFGVEHIVLS